MIPKQEQTHSKEATAPGAQFTMAHARCRVSGHQIVLRMDTLLLESFDVSLILASPFSGDAELVVQTP